ncbi:hypothetical protein GS966_27625 [Rhodococcus hoagii]|nr:hypothetical protein [Prescottella equi]NKS10243.1 hypothetical protein [Prescottella equi]NKS35234.1 hypothetical protein [Prescottella equi]NKS62081.1 hypothetical protein [Prescottella equi]NKS68249.1 hypothetical protein [Prescottella equi]
MTDSDLHRQAWECRESGMEWTAVAAELGCPEAVVQTMAERHQATLDELRAQDQITLFDL